MEKTKEMVRQKKWAFNWFFKFWRVLDDRIVAGSLFHDASPLLKLIGKPVEQKSSVNHYNRESTTARSGLSVSDNWTFFRQLLRLKCYERRSIENRRFWRGRVVTLDELASLRSPCIVCTVQRRAVKTLLNPAQWRPGKSTLDIRS